jgi:hypothetical protein
VPQNEIGKDLELGAHLSITDLAKYLYEIMERIEDDYSPGPPWEDLASADREWYFRCAGKLLVDHQIRRAAKSD